MQVIAKSSENLISVSTARFRFIDSLQHLPSSLETLVANLLDHGTEHFHCLRQEFPDPEEFNLLMRKGSFPYEFVTELSSLYETLPPHSAFYSKLRGKNISNEEYETVCEVYQKFNMRSLRDLLILYNKQDVLLLADVVTFYRQNVRDSYNLEALAYLTSPSLTLDAALKFSQVCIALSAQIIQPLIFQVKIELLTCNEMYLFIERSLRGGVACASEHYAKANNKYMSNFNPEEKSSYIFYGKLLLAHFFTLIKLPPSGDVVNLYGFCLGQHMPTGNFQWVEWELNNLLLAAENYNVDDPTGYLIEVDISIPPEKHDFFKDYPPIAEHLLITDDMLSAYSRKLQEHFNIRRSGTKLAPNLLPKKKYVCHILNIQMLLSLGCEIEAVHRVLKFDQSNYLESYISYNTMKRKNSKSKAEKNFYKLMINSLYG